jgi:hypothetical protein
MVVKRSRLATKKVKIAKEIKIRCTGLVDKITKLMRSRL